MTSISLATLARRAADLGDPLPCSDETQLWFSEHPADLELAKALCATCPLRRPCLAGAIDRAEPFGVWGGEIFEKGRIIAYKRPRGHPGRRARCQLTLPGVLVAEVPVAGVYSGHQAVSGGQLG